MECSADKKEKHLPYMSPKESPVKVAKAHAGYAWGSPHLRFCLASKIPLQTFSQPTQEMIVSKLHVHSKGARCNGWASTIFSSLLTP